LALFAVKGPDAEAKPSDRIVPWTALRHSHKCRILRL